jgi:hypothetical protein
MIGALPALITLPQYQKKPAKEQNKGDEHEARHACKFQPVETREDRKQVGQHWHKRHDQRPTTPAGSLDATKLTTRYGNAKPTSPNTPQAAISRASIVPCPNLCA